MQKKIHILALAGSLREKSYNRSLLNIAKETAPSHAQIEIFDLKDIPIFNQDHETSLPPTVSAFKAKIKAADGILMAVPEYNYSISGVLKNAIDWGSRPYGDNSWDNKFVAIMGASMGLLGTARAQYHLRQVFVTLNMHALNKPEVMIASAQDKFDEKGQLTDPGARKRIADLVNALANACAGRQ